MDHWTKLFYIMKYLYYEYHLQKFGEQLQSFSETT